MTRFSPVTEGRYAMDYPWQFEPEEVVAHDELALDAGAKRALMQTNAERCSSFDSGGLRRLRRAEHLPTRVRPPGTHRHHRFGQGGPFPGR